MDSKDAGPDQHASARIAQKRSVFERLANQFQVLQRRSTESIRFRYVFHSTQCQPALLGLDQRDNDEVWQSFEMVEEAMPNAWGSLVFQIERQLIESLNYRAFESWRQFANTAGFELYQHLAFAKHQIQLGPNIGLWISSMTRAHQAGIVRLPSEMPTYVDRSLEIKLAEQEYLSPDELSSRGIRRVSASTRLKWSRKLLESGIETVFDDVIAASELWANYLATNDFPYVVQKIDSSPVQKSRKGRRALNEVQAKSSIRKSIAEYRQAKGNRKRSLRETIRRQAKTWSGWFQEVDSALYDELVRKSKSE